MLYVFYGTEKEKAGDKARSLVNSLRQKRPDAAFIHVTGNEWSSSLIEEHIGGQGLFSNKYIIFLDCVTENAEAKEKLADFAEVMQKSTNIFIICEGKILVDLKKSLEKYAEKIVVCDEKAAGPAKGAKPEFNIFALGDAIGSRDIMKAWTILRQALDKNNETESIIGTIFWQVKSIILASKAKNAAEAGLSPFVFNNCKKFATKYSQQELNNLLKDLLVLYHEGHRGVGDMEIGLERLVLRL